MGWLERIDPFAVLACLLFVAWVLWRLVRAWSRRVSVAGDDEVRIVLSVAALRGEAGVVTTAAVVRAALCNAEVAAAIERRGLALDAVAARLDELAVPPASRHEAAPTEPMLHARLQEAVAVASARAVARGDAEFSLSDLMVAISDRGGPVADVLTQLGVTFDETWGATTVGGEGRAEEAFVYVWNDDVTPMEKVVEVLREVFGEDDRRASYLMMSVHLRGFVALGPYGVGEAGRLVEEANARAQQLEVPLQVRHEPPDTRGWKQTPRHGLLP